MPQRVETTRWSARGDANEAFVRGYKSIRDTLLDISQNTKYDTKTRCEASGLHKNMCRLETGIMASLWNDILQNLNKTSSTIQNPRILLNTAIACIKSLKEYVAEKRDNFPHYEDLGKKLTEITEYQSKRIRKRNVRLNSSNDPETPEVEFSVSESFRISQYLPIIDAFINALNQRIGAYEEIESRFGFLSKLDELSHAGITESFQRLIRIYSNDLDSGLEEELLQFRNFCLHLLKLDSNMSKEQAMYSLIIDKGVRESFPNVEMVLRIYLTLMICNVTGERSFSK
ncbi:PREDICTED: uncharacterized protein LOC108776350 [Cyphomyrmex costatus]|uniref:uncharacterized protein LOC108776350 n=1 Tax=Cyphomyrmex costatus TaxID=456900 RepID=UPI0008523F5D|nr:PREDICTED: uncharacterized protein LOC108776350 [Cyphomyrmex costatus]